MDREVSNKIRPLEDILRTLCAGWKNDIKDLINCFERLKADIALVKNVDELLERLMETENAVLGKWSVLAM